MSIDWNTAPEGATHWEPTGPEFHEGWMKKEGDYWFYWAEGPNKWFHGPSCNVSAERAARFEARPQEAWDGQGLPPVGVRVSVFDDGDLVYGHGESGEVIAHVEDCAVIRMSYGLGCFTAKNLRTPEQIAAEEREKAIEEMCFAEETLTVKQAKALYEAGYRRQESST
ncbi:TPA: hypothetical protein NH745_004890 [Pseudomonas aeruginosa]|uniref:hypothetical protein n=1 Tax=Pseudomonas aeruginosa TaxID=287 RepID=UPI000BB78D2D|nr:hypothetical protein [Pseudomonas aeruginosa]MBG4113703.1 hypothetical protein [Pseudomonas aeruginosa]MBG6817930.1 hypothetical protein [Pseudomonas aeruginosa]MBI6936627.1 hypothetical protein [Pseudomonas aeruginosa]MBI8011979.1 hypothetical protein [Pseudomonas aeruginosa]MCO1981713.1 hypothetical protein [Pseudomonas aeruginosa]